MQGRERTRSFLTDDLGLPAFAALPTRFQGGSRPNGSFGLMRLRAPRGDLFWDTRAPFLHQKDDSSDLAVQRGGRLRFFGFFFLLSRVVMKEEKPNLGRSH